MVIFSATTHTDLMLRARNIGVKVEVIHNASAMGAAAASGLQVRALLDTPAHACILPIVHACARLCIAYRRHAYTRLF